MGGLKNLRVRARLGLCLAVVLLLQAGIAAWGLHGLQEQQARWAALARAQQQEAAHVAAMRRAAQDLARAAGDVLQLSEPGAAIELQDGLMAARNDYDTHEAQLAYLLRQAPADALPRADLLASLQPRRALAGRLLDRVVELGLARQRDDARQLMRSVAQPAITAWLTALSDLADLQQRASLAATRQREAEAERTRLHMLLTGLVVLCAGLLAALRLSRSGVPLAADGEPGRSWPAAAVSVPGGFDAAAALPARAAASQIGTQAHRIAEIVGVIDGIAMQSKLLTLNASVEATRADRSDQALAAVATEVQQLARRSAVAAAEIQALICTSVDKVEVGVRLVDAAGQRLEDIVAQVRQVLEHLAEAQADGVVSALARPFEPAQAPAQLLRESAAAADNLRAQAARMARAVSVFKLDAGASPSA